MSGPSTPAAKAALQVPLSGIRPTDYKPRMIGVGNSHTKWNPNTATLHHCQTASRNGFVSSATLSFRKRQKLKNARSKGEAIAANDTSIQRQAAKEMERKERYKHTLKERHRQRLVLSQ